MTITCLISPGTVHLFSRPAAPFWIFSTVYESCSHSIQYLGFLSLKFIIIIINIIVIIVTSVCTHGCAWFPCDGMCVEVTGQLSAASFLRLSWRFQVSLGLPGSRGKCFSHWSTLFAPFDFSFSDLNQCIVIPIISLICVSLMVTVVSVLLTLESSLYCV